MDILPTAFIRVWLTFEHCIFTHLPPIATSTDVRWRQTQEQQQDYTFVRVYIHILPCSIDHAAIHAMQSPHERFASGILQR